MAPDGNIGREKASESQIMGFDPLYLRELAGCACLLDLIQGSCGVQVLRGQVWGW